MHFAEEPEAASANTLFRQNVEKLWKKQLIGHMWANPKSPNCKQTWAGLAWLAPGLSWLGWGPGEEGCGQKCPHLAWGQGCGQNCPHTIGPLASCGLKNLGFVILGLGLGFEKLGFGILGLGLMLGNLGFGDFRVRVRVGKFRV